jgi:hypothetical protein
MPYSHYSHLISALDANNSPDNALNCPVIGYGINLSRDYDFTECTAEINRYETANPSAVIVLIGFNAETGLSSTKKQLRELASTLNLSRLQIQGMNTEEVVDSLLEKTQATVFATLDLEIEALGDTPLACALREKQNDLQRFFRDRIAAYMLLDLLYKLKTPSSKFDSPEDELRTKLSYVQSYADSPLHTYPSRKNIVAAAIVNVLLAALVGALIGAACATLGFLIGGPIGATVGTVIGIVITMAVTTKIRCKHRFFKETDATMAQNIADEARKSLLPVEAANQSEGEEEQIPLLHQTSLG